MVKFNENDDGPLPPGRDWFHIKQLTEGIGGKTLIEFHCRNPQTVHGMMFTLLKTAHEMKNRTGTCDIDILISSVKRANAVMEDLTGKTMHAIMGIKDDADCMSLIAEIFEFFLQGNIMCPERNAKGDFDTTGIMEFFCDEEVAMQRIDSLFQESVL